MPSLTFPCHLPDSYSPSHELYLSVDPIDIFVRCARGTAGGNTLVFLFKFGFENGRKPRSLKKTSLLSRSHSLSPLHAALLQPSCLETLGTLSSREHKASGLKRSLNRKAGLQDSPCHRQAAVIVV
jgi:hypothetical protein